MKLYVGNLSPKVTEEELQAVFSNYGQVISTVIVRDKYSGNSRGFGFVEMPNNEEAGLAINGLNGKELRENVIKVSQAREKPDHRRGDRRRY